tara:strand:- start:351 stop:755 length:405 start_codon:yes stop_codon:yes gene_type:complete
MSLNLLQKWGIEHKKQIKKELKKANLELTIENIPQIIKQTSFKVRSKKYPKACTLYKQGKSCHPKIKDLNCLLCACPNYNSKIDQGGCKIQSKKGKWAKPYIYSKSGKVWDCSDCKINHTPKEVEKYLRNLIKS